MRDSDLLKRLWVSVSKNFSDEGKKSLYLDICPTSFHGEQKMNMSLCSFQKPDFRRKQQCAIDSLQSSLDSEVRGRTEATWLKKMEVEVSWSSRFMVPAAIAWKGDFYSPTPCSPDGCSWCWLLLRDSCFNIHQKEKGSHSSSTVQLQPDLAW